MVQFSSDQHMLVERAVSAIESERPDFRPDSLLILGSGLGDAVLTAEVIKTIAYERIPGMTVTSVAGHAGKLLLVRWGAHNVLVFQGRIHSYEGHPWDRVTLPVRIAAKMKVKTCILTNMSGGINSKLKVGDLVVITDHMNFTGSNPLVGMATSDSSDMFTDMTNAYSPRLRKLVDEAGRFTGIPVVPGVYAGVTGPSYETPAEIRAFGMLGADIIGMSTIGEVLVARQEKLECCAISCVANPAAGVTNDPISHNDVLKTANSVAVRLSRLLDSFFQML